MLKELHGLLSFRVSEGPLLARGPSSYAVHMAKSAPRQYGSTKSAIAAEAPTAEEVEQFHRNADTDVRPESAHHTLGPAGGQASPGDHDHDGANSRKLLEGYTITGDQSDGTVWPSVIACLVRLGAIDSSTP